MTTLSTHILNLMTGLPAAGVGVELFQINASGESRVAAAVTDPDGRITNLAPFGAAPGQYRMRFVTGAYFKTTGVQCFHPYVDVVFEIESSRKHCHVPLLVSAYGYSTYRGS